jgi:two-component system, sensor histidine kinase LadS
VRYWLRLEQDHVEFSAPLRIYRASWLLPVRERVQFLFGAYFGLIALIALGSVANAIVHRDRNFAVFSLYVAALGVGQLAAFGLGEEHLWDGWPRWNETAMFLLPGISSAVGLWFARNVTEPARFSRALDLAVWSLIAAVLSAAALDTLLASPNSSRLVMLVMIVGIAVIGGLLLLALTHAEDPHIGLIATGFVPILVMGVLTALAGLDVLPPSALTREGLPLGAAVGLPLLFYALSLRTSHRREAQLRAASLVRHDVLTGIAHERTLLHRLQGAIDRPAISSSSARSWCCASPISTPWPPSSGGKPPIARSLSPRRCCGVLPPTSISRRASATSISRCWWRGRPLPKTR